VTDPDLLVADEPTGDLDAKSAIDVLTLLRELNHAFEKTVVMVTHDPRGERFVDQVIHLDKGVLANGAASGA
jgi:putative ABC transport system ATP-binding protein